MPDTEPQEGASRRSAGTRRSAWLLLVVVALVGLAASVVAIRRGDSEPAAVAPPEPDLDLCAPRVAETIRRARQSVRDAPRDGDAWGRLGMVLLAHEFEPEAGICFRQAEQLDASDVRWPYLHGMSVMTADRDAAVDSFQRALRTRADLPVVYDRLAELLIEAGRLEEAESYLHASLQLQPRAIRPLVGLARAALMSDRLSEAEQWAARAAQLEPDRRLVHELLASIHQWRGDPEGAMRELDLAAALPDAPLGWNDPFAEEVLALRQDAWRLVEEANALLSQQRAPEAIGLLQRALREDDRDPRVHCTLARALIQAGEVQQAGDVLDHALILHPASAEVRFQRGVVFYVSGEFEQSERLFREAIAAKPDYALAHYNLGHALERLGDVPGALESFRAAAGYRPKFSGAHVNAGRILLELGRLPEARSHLETAVLYAPENAEARQLLARVSDRSEPPRE